MEEVYKPHYVYVCCVLYQGKIWKWNVSLSERTLSSETMYFPKGFDLNDRERFYNEFAEMIVPIWVWNREQHNHVFEVKSKDMYRTYQIHEDYCNGGKPY